MRPENVTRILIACVLIAQAVLIAQNCAEARAPQASTAAATPTPAPAAPEELEQVRNKRGKLMTKADIVAMVNAVENESLPVDMRVWAALQLESTHVDYATEALIETLDHPDLTLATAALQALSGVRDPRVINAARRGEQHEEEDVRVISRYVLESIGEPITEDEPGS